MRAVSLRLSERASGEAARVRGETGRTKAAPTTLRRPREQGAQCVGIKPRCVTTRSSQSHSHATRSLVHAFHDHIDHLLVEMYTTNEQEKAESCEERPVRGEPSAGKCARARPAASAQHAAGSGRGCKMKARAHARPHRQDEEHGSRDQPEHVERGDALWCGRACHGARAAVRSGAAGRQRPVALLHRGRKG